MESLRNKLEKEQPAAFLLAINASRRMHESRSWMKNNRPTDVQVHDLISQVHGWGSRDESTGTVHPGHYGHGGVERTLQLLRDHIAPSKWWSSMRTDVRNYIHKCPQCQFMTAAKVDIHERRSVHPFNMSVGKPMDRINIDSIGPFPEDEEGNKYVMVFIDVFSRFVELVPVPDLTALVAAKEVIKFIGRYGCPREILTDNGTQFANELAYQIYDTAMINHLTVMPYSHEENSIVERANREVNTHLRAIVFDRKIKVNWSLALPLIQRVMNTFEHSSIGCAPSQIIFGNAIDLDRNILHKYEGDEANAPDLKNQTYSKYYQRLLNMQAEVVARAQTIQETVNQKHISRKLQKFTNTDEYNVNDYVLWEYPESNLRKDSRPDRLSSHYRGPYRVISSQEGTLQIQNLITEEQHHVLINHVKPFRYDPNIVDPKTVALHAQSEFYLEKILDLHGTRKKQRFQRKKLQVQVRWLGYAHQHDSWVEYDSVKTSDVFIKFCAQKGFKYLLDKPQKLRLKELQDQAD